MDLRPRYQVQPFAYGDNMDVAYKRLMDVLNADPKATIVTNTERYVHATFTSSVLGFVDDVEFLFDSTTNIIHVRSASRSGYYDFGVNAKRVARLRTHFNALDAPR